VSPRSERSVERTRATTLPRGLVVALTGGGLLLVTMVVLLALTLGEIRTTRTHVAAADHKVTALLQLTKPALTATAPAVEKAQPLIADLQPVIRTLGDSLPTIVGTARGILPALDRLPAFVVEGQQLIGAVFPALQTLQDSELPATFAAARILLGQLQGPGLIDALAQAQSLVDRAVALDLPDRAVRAAKRVKQILAIQVHTLDVQRQSLAVQRRSLKIQTQTLGHVRSLDNRTGGTLPPPLGH
jgi:hypothetical protein